MCHGGDVQNRVDRNGDVGFRPGKNDVISINDLMISWKIKFTGDRRRSLAYDDLDGHKLMR